MEIRHLPIAAPSHALTSTQRDTASSSRQKNSGEEYNRSVKASEQAQASNTSPQQALNTTALYAQFQQSARQQSHQGNLHQPQLRHSAQQAINTYQDIEHQEELNSSAEFLSRVDLLV